MTASLSLERHRITGEVVVVVTHEAMVDLDSKVGMKELKLSGISDADLLGFAGEIIAACQENLVATQKGLPLADTVPAVAPARPDVLALVREIAEEREARLLHMLDGAESCEICDNVGQRLTYDMHASREHQAWSRLREALGENPAAHADTVPPTEAEVSR